MIGLIIALITFNFIAFYTNRRLTLNQIVHIWCFTVALHLNFDFYIDLQYKGYWYFSQKADWMEIPTNIFLLPPVNMIFLNFFPFHKSLLKKGIFFILFLIAIILYEVITLLPEPWGYFHYGWWNLGYTAMLNPILLFILLGYYKWICHIEQKINKKFILKK
jgi:hypothetical protein